METDGLPKLDEVIFGEIQVLLAEKRTALASLRTGIAVFALPLSMLSALIATSRYYSMEKAMPLLAPLLLLNLGLVVLGSWLVFRSITAFTTTSGASESSVKNIGRSQSLSTSANEHVVPNAQTLL